MATYQPVRVAIIGAAKRSSYLYGPLVKALPKNVELVSIWGRSPDSARDLGESLNVPCRTKNFS
jgi:predicted dehydrogenase